MVKLDPRDLFRQHKKSRKPIGKMPNFLVIGSAKFVTTSLHEYLDQHPDIYTSSVREPNLFAFKAGIPEQEVFRFLKVIDDFILIWISAVL
jgi:hypothetical protein